MLGTVQVGYVSHIAFEPFIAYITKENLLLLTLLVRLYRPNIFLNVQVFLPPDKHTLLLSCLCDCFLLMIALDSLLNLEFLAAKLIILCCYRTLCLRRLAHLLYTQFIIPVPATGWNYSKIDIFYQEKAPLEGRLSKSMVKCIYSIAVLIIIVRSLFLSMKSTHHRKLREGTDLLAQ